MSDKSFVVRLGIDTPISLRGLLHLDALLGYVVTARGGDMADIPLERAAGVWQASAGLLETGPFGPVTSSTQRVRKINEDGIPEKLFDHLPPSAKNITGMHRMRSRIVAYPTLDGVRAVWFAGRGDVEAVAELLADVGNLGAMSRTGYGRIVERRVERTGDDVDCGLRLRDGQPARTIGLEGWTGIYGTPPVGAMVGMSRAAPPYWTGVEQPCVSPSQNRITGTARDVAGLLGT